MTAKQYLQQLRKLDLQIDADVNEERRLRSMIESIGATDYAKDKVQASSYRATEDGILKLLEMQEEINAEIDRYAQLRNTIRRRIMALPDAEERVALKLRYIDGMEWWKIADVMHYSVRAVMYIHRNALSKFECLHSIADLNAVS